MTWIKGIDFRGTSDYVVDPANCTYCLADQYPTDRGGVVFGWDGDSIGAGDRSAGSDARIAGTNTIPGGFTRTFRVDLPATGAYKIGLGIGDANGGSNGYCKNFVIKDNSTVLATIDKGDNVITNGSLVDADGTELTAANWPSQNTLVELTFASQILIVTMDTTAFDLRIAHLYIEQVAAAGPSIPVLMNSYKQQ